MMFCSDLMKSSLTIAGSYFEPQGSHTEGRKLVV